MRALRYGLFLLGLLILPSFCLAEVMVSIKPLALIYQALMPEAAPAKVLLPKNQNMHDYALSIQDIQDLQQAETFFWLGNQNEQFLKRLQKRLKNVAWHSVAGNTHSTHPWLSFTELPELINNMARILQEQQPDKVIAIEANKIQLLVKIAMMQEDWQKALSANQTTPFLLGHDAFAALAQSLGLKGVVFYYASHDHAHQQSGTKTLATIQQQIKQGQIRCAIEEPEVSFKQLKARFTGLQTIHLNPNADNMPESSHALLDFLQQTTAKLAQCLKGEH